MRLSKIIHENKSQGVLWRFQEGPRIWTERQKRGLVVGGELNGQRLTKYDIQSTKWAFAYFQYNNCGSGPEPFVWVYIT
jgi:hypothetical protein